MFKNIKAAMTAEQVKTTEENYTLNFLNITVFSLK